MTETYKVGDTVRYTADNFGLMGAEGVVKKYGEGICPALVNFKSLNKTWWCSLAHLELIKEVTMKFKVGDRVRHTWMYKGVDKGIVVSIHPQAAPDGGYCLVKFDNGQTLSIRDGQAEILKEVTMEIPKVYKALVKTRGGRLVSIWAETLLDYHEGEVTYAPKGSMGIFIKTSLEGAKYNGMSNSKRRCKELEGTLVVHEATPLGNLCSKAGHSTFLSDDRYPAILLGKEVWRDEPKEEPRPEPKFKAGDRVKVVGGDYHRREDFTVELTHWGADSPRFRGHAHWHYGFKVVGYYDPEGYFVDEEHLELAPEPKEAWVDVTKECEVKLNNGWKTGAQKGNYVSVCHNNRPIFSFGSVPHIESGRSGYKVILEQEDASCGYGGFTILKKVMK